SWAALPARTGQKPDLLAMRQTDMQGMLFHQATLVAYMFGQFGDTLAATDAHVAYRADSPYLGHGVWMIADASIRQKDWAGLARRMKAMMDAGNISVSPQAELLGHFCTGSIEYGRELATQGKTADAMAALAQAGKDCTPDEDKAGEAFYRLGEVAEAAGQFDKAREAFGRVLNDFRKSRFQSMASRGFGRVKNK
ncbi:MAG: tetratricopeptide repeat protein, partial [Deltaproteobacteria bacterium]|nr:tetratricopeptide repeat protein [Deltaproteobacteria bacterium]